MPEADESGQTRRLAAILSTDAAGYSAHMSADEAGTDAVLRECLEAMRAEVEGHRGQTIAEAGDGLIAIFDSATGAIDCARALARMVAAKAYRIGSAALEFRTGMCLGEVILRDDSAFGEAVNVAKRLEQIALPGQVFVAESLYEQVVGKTDAGFEYLGERTLKNIPRQVPVYRLIESATVAARAASPRRGGASADLGRPVLAVLPIDDFSEDKDKSWLCDCITEEIILRVSRFREIPVISRNSVFALRDNAWGIRRIAEELRAKYIVEGSVRADGKRVRVTAQLIEAERDFHAWSGSFDGDLDDMFRLLDTISEALVGALVGRIEMVEEGRAQVPSPLASSYERIARARQCYWQGDRLGLDEAERLCRECIDVDPGYSAAWALLSRIHNTRWLYGWTTDAEMNTAMETAEAAARKAIALDVGDARAYAELGLVLLFQRKHQLALQAYERALSTNPNDADILAEYADMLHYLGRQDEALVHIRRAMALNPFYPDWYLWNLADIHFELDQFDAVVNTIYQMRNPLLGSRLLAASFALSGRMEEAREAARDVLIAAPDFSASDWTERQPDLDRSRVGRFADALRLAGLPG